MAPRPYCLGFYGGCGIEVGGPCIIPGGGTGGPGMIGLGTGMELIIGQVPAPRPWHAAAISLRHSAIGRVERRHSAIF